MKMSLLSISAGLALLLAPVESQAGPCTDQISALQKMISSHDAGSGPTMTTGSTQSPAGDAGAGVSALPRQVPPAGEAPKTNATTAMNAAAQDKATSPQDVRSQIQGQPTASQVASGATAQPDKMKQIDATLSRARSADQNSDASGCASAINEAKRLLGSE